MTSETDPASQNPPKEKSRPDQDRGGYIPFEFGAEYGGAEKLVAEEFAWFNKNKSGKLPSKGLALSGGGIRSATFCLGVLQALAKSGKLQEIDYLSTVSGGGYIGSALSWFLHRPWPGGTREDGIKYPKLDFNVNSGGFPFGIPGKSDKEKKYKNIILQSLRQHGKYLAPGHGITAASMLAVILRAILIGLVFYLPLFTLVMWALICMNFIKAPSLPPGWWTCLVIFILALFFGVSIFYAWSTRFVTEDREIFYRSRRGYEKWAGFLLMFAALFLAIGSLPIVTRWEIGFLNQHEDGMIKFILTAIPSLLGFISAIAAFFKSGEKKRGGIPSNLLAVVSSALLIYGFLLGAYQIAVYFCPGKETGWIFWAFIIVAGITGLLVNPNYISIHRYYRDRLMEAFMPDLESIITEKITLSPANNAWLKDMIPSAKKGPYHIINANIVLVNSQIPKFRGRGGDNFILSPLYCGSNATGWRQTACYMEGKMSLPSAMAVSGAAVNPSAGVGGEGPTRNRALSILMSLLNLRLGLWVPNPNPGKSWSRRCEDPMLFHPNPLLRAVGLVGENETSRFIELTDGGHFENLGLYELVRRRLDTIIVCDGSADPKFTFEDLGNAIEKARVDFGVLIEIPTLCELVPQEDPQNPGVLKLAQSGCVEGKIVYPPDNAGDQKTGKLIYLNTSLIKGLPEDLYAYKRAHPAFPDDSTVDQFFDEKQFEAYRELGFQIGLKAQSVLG